MSISGIMLGLVDIAIVVVLLLLVGALALWLLSWANWAPPLQVQKLYIALVVLIALGMIIALVFGVARLRIISGVDAPFRAAVASRAVAAVSTAAAANLRPVLNA